MSCALFSHLLHIFVHYLVAVVCFILCSENVKEFDATFFWETHPERLTEQKKRKKKEFTIKSFEKYNELMTRKDRVST